MNQAEMFLIISRELNLKESQVRQTVQLLDDGSTIPFISRYRKEMTGMLDENQIRSIQERIEYLRQLEERKNEVIRLIDEQGKLTDELTKQIHGALKLQEVEDLYRPYRQKRRTRATIAREKGLETFAQFLLQARKGNVEEEAKKYLNEEKEVSTEAEAIKGACDILAEDMADDANLRDWIRRYIHENGVIQSRVKEAEKDERKVYEMYYEYQEPVGKMAPHRVLAVNRGEREGILKVKIDLDERPVLHHMEKKWAKTELIALNWIQETIHDSYRRLIFPSVEREIRNFLTEKGEEQAIHIFAENLRALLLQPPIKGKTVLGLDPGFRTGCKLAVIDETGKLLDVGVIYPTPPVNKVVEARKMVIAFIQKYGVDIVAIGNGTASRESEQFIADILKDLKEDVAYLIVSEAGASVYSASKLAGEEFPSLDVSERSAVSISRRLQDPLAELVKIDPKSIGVGQYQHDVTQSKLASSLQFVVESAVNYVGVDVNTASPSLLQYVSGISKQVAGNIINKRDKIGKFSSRRELKDVPRLGDKTYEQCIGFLRIPDGDNPFDATPIHPESYVKVDALLRELEINPRDIHTPEAKEKLKNISLEEMAETLDVGVPTLQDIIESLIRPGRDPREDLPQPILKKDVLSIDDLQEGMELKGTIRNVVDFGAFVDIGLKNDALVHISQLANKFIKHPLDVVSIGDIVTVRVKDVDREKGRVGLTMRF